MQPGPRFTFLLENQWREEHHGSFPAASTVVAAAPQTRGSLPAKLTWSMAAKGLGPRCTSAFTTAAGGAPPADCCGCTAFRLARLDRNAESLSRLQGQGRPQASDIPTHAIIHLATR